MCSFRHEMNLYICTNFINYDVFVFVLACLSAVYGAYKPITSLTVSFHKFISVQVEGERLGVFV